MAAGKRSGVNKSLCGTFSHSGSHVIGVFRPLLCKSRVRVSVPEHRWRLHTYEPFAVTDPLTEN